MNNVFGNVDPSKIVMSLFSAMSSNQHYSTIRLTKLEDGENAKYAPDHTRHIKTGFVAEGLMLRPVAIGESFYVDYPDAKNHFHTSVVQEILSENTFKTMNSVYKFEIVKP